MGLAALWHVEFLLGPEIEPVSPALAGGFLTTGPWGKSNKIHLNGFKNMGKGVKADGDQG